MDRCASYISGAGRSGHQHSIFTLSKGGMLIRIVNVLDDIFRVEQDHNVMSQRADRVHAASRGAERRRHLLNYLRQHLEELRPYERRRLWYVEPDAISNAVGYAKFFSRSHDAVIRVCDEAGNVIETHEEAGEFKASIKESLPCHPSRRCENETVDLPMLFVM